jgi:hypothetical protein
MATGAEYRLRQIWITSCCGSRLMYLCFCSVQADAFRNLESAWTEGGAFSCVIQLRRTNSAPAL